MASLMILLNQTQSSSSESNTAAEASLNSSRSNHNKNANCLLNSPNSAKLKMELDEANHQQQQQDEIQSRKSPRTYLTTVSIKSENIGKESPNIFRQKLAATPPPPPPSNKDRKPRIKYHYKQEAYTNRSNDSQLVNLSTSDEINSCESMSSSSSLSASSPPPTLSDDSPCEYDASKLQQRGSGDLLQESQLTVKLNKTPAQLELDSRVKKPSSISSSPRSKCTNKSSTSNMATKKFDKPKKRVSFNDDLLQVHLIPFNNYQNILSVEQYKCQLRMMTQTNNDSKNYNNYEDFEMPIENYSMEEIDNKGSTDLYNLESLNLTTANSDSSVTTTTQTSFANFLPRSLQKRYWSKDSRLESINNAILLNQRHYASILGNPAVNQISIKQQPSKPSMLWPSHSFSENNRPLSSANNSRLSRYCSSSFRTLLPTPNDTSNNASNVSAVSFELTDENSLLQPPQSSQLARGLSKAKKVYPRNNSINYIFLKPDEHKISKQGSLVGANPRNSANLSGIDSTGVHNKYINNTGCNLNSTTFMSISNYKTLTPEFLRSNTATEVNAKQQSRTTNELFALKDINYYVTSTSQSGAKRHGPKTETEANEGNSIKVNSTSQITPLTPSQQQHHTAENARRTRSALPLLRNNLKYTKTISSLPSKDINANNSNLDAIKNGGGQQENHLTVNLNTCFNATSYKLVNSPLLNNLNRTKKILCNASNAPAVIYEKKLREN